MFVSCNGQISTSIPQTQPPAKSPTVFYTPTINGQISTSIPQTQSPTKSPTALHTPTKKPTIRPLSSPTYTATPTRIPLMTHVPSSETAIEVIVFSWDGGTLAGMPDLHIWKDNRAMWGTVSRDKESPQYGCHVYETILSDDEISKVQETIKESGLWEFEEPGFPVPDYSWDTISANQSGREKKVVVNGPKFGETVDALMEILNSSQTKTEYFPKQGYLFAGIDIYGDDDSAFPWPDELLAFNFRKYFDLHNSEEGVLIDGEILSTVWESLQKGYHGINYRNNTYYYSLQIPGLTCLYNYDEVKHLWECNMYVNQLP